MPVTKRCADVQMCNCAGVHMMEVLRVLLVMLIKQDTRPQGSEEMYKM